MNTRLKELMLQAGYAAPELATRAQVLAKLIVDECAHVGFNAAYPGKGVEVLLAIKQHLTDDQS